MNRDGLLVKIILLFLLAIMTLVSAGAQEDSHYWSHQYGAKGLLLNGAVIANADGETSIFYNPGGMGFADDIGFAFSFLTPTYSQLDNINYIGDGNTITDKGYNLSPGFLAVTYKPFEGEKLIIGAAAFKRYNTDINFDERVIGALDVDNFFIYRADLDFRREISEDWYGLSLAHQINDKIGIGVSQFLVWRGEGGLFNLKKEILPGVAPETIIQSWRYELGYDLSIRGAFTTKVGFNYRSDDVSVGLTFTSPLYGIVNTQATYSIDDQRIDTDAELFSTRSNSKSLPINDYKAPASVGVGVDFVLNKKLRLSYSAEYFWPTSDIAYIDDTDDALDGLGRNGPLDYTFGLSTRRESVFNIAVGFQYQRSEKVKWMGGIRTDFSEKSSYLINNETEYLGTGPSIVNLSGGGTFTWDQNDFSFGMNLGYGQSTGRRQLIDLTNINSDNIYELSANSNVKSRYFSAMLFITYDFIFNSL